jgi:hypothetical protein
MILLRRSKKYLAFASLKQKMVRLKIEGELLETHLDFASSQQKNLPLLLH